jgi:hypothetical protein
MRNRIIIMVALSLCVPGSGCRRGSPEKYETRGAGVFLIKDEYRRIISPDSQMAASIIDRRYVYIEPNDEQSFQFSIFSSGLLSSDVFSWTDKDDAAWDINNNLVVFRNGRRLGFFSLSLASNTIVWTVGPD